MESFLPEKSGCNELLNRVFSIFFNAYEKELKKVLPLHANFQKLIFKLIVKQWRN